MSTRRPLTPPAPQGSPGEGPAVDVDGLVKQFGEQRALDGVTMRVPRGSVFGFLGRNGAGKTTTLRILLGLARPTGGHARVLGADVTRFTPEERGRIGYLPDVPGYYPWMTGPELLTFCGKLHRVPTGVLAERVEVLLGMAGLTGVPQRVGGYSRGMKQRLGIAQALVNAPELLLLDEPTAALDPLGRKAVLDMIATLKGRTTVLFSTHILDDAQRVCDTVAILERGRVLLQSGTAELMSRYGQSRRMEVQVASGADLLAEALHRQAWAGEVSAGSGQGSVVVQVPDLEVARLEMPRLVAELGLGVVRLESQEATLEDVFVELVGTR